MTLASPKERALAYVVSLLALGLVLSPLLRHPDEDSFPLSTFPMFSHERPRRMTLTHAVGVDAQGERRQRVGYGSAGIEAMVADLVEAVGQDVLHEAAQEVYWVQRDGLAVLCAEGHGVVGDGGEAAVGDGDTMSVAAQVTQHVIRAPERLLGVDDPGHASETSHETVEGF